ncbi:MAG: hypothetical protein IJD28_05815, partial [Deferribacterales bacterium]|nr:hypothetical protein [Deferribacterales bacterium]
YICEVCGVDLHSNRNLLHVHHIDGVKSNNISTNLMCVCAECHKKQPMHDHMRTVRSNTIQLALIRKEQGLLHINSWEDLFRLVDVSLHGLLALLSNDKRIPLPAVGTYLKGDNTKYFADLYWEHDNIAISVDVAVENYIMVDKWKVYNVIACLNNMDILADNF